MERREYEREVVLILGAYRRNAAAGLRAELRLLEQYVRDRGFEGDHRAMALVVLLDADRPTPRFLPP